MRLSFAASFRLSLLICNCLLIAASNQVCVSNQVCAFRTVRSSEPVFLRASVLF
ncbi:hypothetical protein [Methanimicrococcus hongohii]|uniref:hypothetical protein n=1 Tax=Methanimicrococcus hongohii TaxID=3028295 RepID=UPI002930D3B2|nr:hypothetical protein [Methanimicrococcus sp. Hf6]